MVESLEYLGVRRKLVRGQESEIAEAKAQDWADGSAIVEE